MTEADLAVPTAAGTDEETAARRRAAGELRERLADHGAAFYRMILQGAFERIYQPDGSYRLREIGSGLFLEELTATRARARLGNARERQPKTPGGGSAPV